MYFLPVNIFLYLFYNEVMGYFYFFRRGCETILGETSDPLEIFITDECDDAEAETVVSKVIVSIYFF